MPKKKTLEPGRAKPCIGKESGYKVAIGYLVAIGCHKTKMMYQTIEIVFPNEIHCFQNNCFVLDGFYHPCALLIHKIFLKAQEKLAIFIFDKFFMQMQ